MATYYVKNSGSDLLDGLSVETAWGTVAKVSGFSFAPGDNVLFQCNETHVGNLQPAAHGLSTSWITYGSWGLGNKPIINANNSARCIFTNAKNYVKFENFKLINPGTRHAVAQNSIAIISGCEAVDGNYDHFYQDGGTVTWRDCTATGGAGNSTYGFTIINAAVATIVDCIADGTWGGYSFSNTSVSTLYRCIARDITAYTGFIGVSASVSTLYDCIAHDCALDAFSTSGTATMNCWYCAGFDNVLLGDGYTAHDASTMNLYYCLGWGNGKSGAAMTGTSSGVIYGCTFYNNYSAAAPTTSYGIWLNATGTWVVKNNITKHNLYEMYVTATAVAGGITLTSDYNCFHDSRGGNAFHYNGTDYNFANYKTASGKEANSLNVDPLMVDVAANKFYLRYDSPCIGAGVSIAGYEAGLDKLATWPDGVVLRRQEALWDIGAYPYRSAGHSFPVEA